MILVNLCCGRNPWKRASAEDATFLAYLKDPQFLMSILPVSAELNVILRRIFECDPNKRVTIPELRRLIVECPSLTVLPSSTALCTPPQTPPCQSYPYAKEHFDYMSYGAYSSPGPIGFDYSSSVGSGPSLSDGSSISSSSSSSENADYNTNAPSLQILPNFWGSFIPFPDIGDKTVPQQHLEPAIVVC